ncbi:MAG: cation:proton antiporter, partial [Mailhella sp.]|nr:cation:proton antiporter [Mailhella sp.]
MNPIFSEIVLMFLLAILVVLICRRLKLPNIVGFLITGLLCGPSAFAIVSEAELVDSLSEVGVSLLLFTIGMELSTKELKRMAKPLFIGGTTQVLLTIGLVFLACFFFAGAPKAIVFGCLIALSSTAIVLTLLQQKAQGDSPQGRVCLAILIFQDLAIVPIMLLFPMLSGGLQMDMGSALLTIGKAVAVLAALAAFAVFLLPRLMMLIVRTRSRELMLMMTLGLCLTVAEITSRIGLSTSLGAFLAGLMLAESEYSLNVTENILPFKDIFTSIFFISVGMQIDMNMFISNLHWIVLMAAGIIAVKTAAVLPAVKLVGYSLHTAIIAALSLAQIGEFSFVLVTNAESLGILTEHQSQLFIAASILTMIATPILMGIAPAAADAALKLMGRSRIAEPEETGEEGEELRDHIIIIGFGIGGQTLARVAQKSGIPYVISELNPDTVARYKKDHPIRHGDAQYPLVLEHLGIKEARVLAILTSDPAGMRGIIANARAANPNIRIVVRSRFIG